MHQWKHILLPLLFCIAGNWVDCLFISPVAAQSPGMESKKSEIETPKGGFTLTPPSGIQVPAPLVSTTIKMTISGIIARTTLSQQFTNPSSEWTEGVYVFPLPEQAAVDHLRMRVGERIIEGIIKERSEAKKTYAKAKASGQRASLLEQERPNMFTASVANIAPGDSITVDIEYQEVVRYDQGQFSLRVPMVVGPRYIPGHPIPADDLLQNTQGMGWAPNTNQVPDASRITPPVQHPHRGPLNSVILQIDLASGLPLRHIESPTHSITVTKQESDRYQITFQKSQIYADRDFELIWTPLLHETPHATVFTEEVDGERYVFLQLMPPVQQALNREPISREVVFVIDTSGSMAGTSLTQGKRALTLALSRLTPMDRLNLIQFNSVTHTLFPISQPATPSIIQQALHYVHNLKAEGGTKMLPAFVKALSGGEETTRLRQIIFVTDGLIGNEEELFTVLKRDLHHNRLFTVGIGSAPNGFFMRKAAEFGRGTFTYIGTTKEVKEKMNRLFRKLEQPALMDITISSSTEVTRDLAPSPIPDLYSGEPLTVAFRTTDLPTSLTITGKRKTEWWSSTQSLTDSKPRRGIAIYWARRAIAQLMDRQRKNENTQLHRQKILEIALQHHLVSRYSSLVAVDVTPIRPDNTILHTHAQKTNLPHGMQYEAVFGWSQTATPAPLLLCIGFLTVALACGSYYLAGRQT